MKKITRALLVFLLAIAFSGAIVITGCTPEPVTTTHTITTTATKTLPPETTTVTPEPTVPDPIARDLTADEAYAMLQDNANSPEFVILDVRSPEEHAESHIEGSALVDMRGNSWLPTVEVLDRSYTYLVY